MKTGAPDGPATRTGTPDGPATRTDGVAMRP